MANSAKAKKRFREKRKKEDLNKKNKGFRNKGPRYWEKLRKTKKIISNFFRKESKIKNRKP